MPINKNIVGREITHEELQEDLFPDFGNDTINKEDTSHTITTPPRATATGAGVKVYKFRNQNYLNSGSSLNIKQANKNNFLDISSSSTLSHRSTDEDLTIDNTKIHFKDGFIYDVKVKITAGLEVSSNQFDISLAKDISNIYDSGTISTAKLTDNPAYSVFFESFLYEASKGDVRIFVTDCSTGGSRLDIHTIKITIKEIGEKV